MKPVRWLVFSGLILAGLAIVITPVMAGSFTSDAVIAGAGFLVASSLGGVIIARRDGHPTGWMLTSIGVAIVFANGFASLPGVSDTAIAWVASWAWTLVFALICSARLDLSLRASSPCGRVFVSRESNRVLDAARAGGSGPFHRDPGRT